MVGFISVIWKQLARRVLLLVFLLVGLFGMSLSILWMLCAIIFSPFGSRAWNIAQAFDRLGNATTGGNGKETISARAAKNMPHHKWACYLCKFLDWLQKDHCKKSIET